MRRKSILFLACLLLLIVGALFLWSRANSSVPPFLATPAPAFDTLVRASRALADNRAEPAPDELAEYVEVNAPALKMVRDALAQKFEAPSAAYNIKTLDTVLKELGSFKSLAIALRNEGKFHESQTNLATATQSYLDVVRLGTKVESGPVILALVGISIERIGLSALEQLSPDLTAEEGKQLASHLRKINSERIPFGEIEQRERLILRRNAPTPIHVLILSRFNRAPLLSAQSKYEQASLAVEALARKLESQN